MPNWMGVGNDPSYSSSRTFETFPFPWPPGTEPLEDGRLQAIAISTRVLVARRDNWLKETPEDEAPRTLTRLYNKRPTWLSSSHRELDHAVLAAYGWPPDLTDAEILERLLALNLERAGKAS